MRNNLLLDEYPLVVLPQLAAKIGLNEAIVLQQIHYWLQRSPTEGLGFQWVGKTVDQWREQFPFFSERTIRRSLDSLREQGLIVSIKLNASSHDHSNFYRINYQNDLFDVAKMASSDVAKLAASSISIETKEIIREKTQKKTRLTTIPEGFTVSEGVKKWAQTNGYSAARVNQNYAKFVLWAESKGQKYASWDAALKTAIRDNWADVKESSGPAMERF